MVERIERKRLTILKILQVSGKPMGSLQIAQQLRNRGYEISERTVRFHLQALDQRGFTENMGIHGRRVTEVGKAELARARVFEKVGFLNAQIDQMTYRMRFDPDTWSAGCMKTFDQTRRGHESLRIFCIDAALQGMS